MNSFKKLSFPPLLFFSISAAFPPYSQADALPYRASDGLKQEQPAVRMQENVWLEQIAAPSDHALPKQTEKEAIKPVTNEDLMKQPELLHNLMLRAINSGDRHLLESLTAAYRKHPQADAVLLARAEGMIARYKGDYPKATAIYTKLHDAHPEDTRITLDTAAILWEDRQWKEADRLFAEAAATPQLPEGVLENIAVYRKQSKEANKWHFNGGFSVTRDNNVNNAAPPYCSPLGCVKQQAESATGLNYQLSVEKNTPVKGHHNVLFRSNLSGVSYYFDKKSQYDNAFGRAYLGWQYQNARTTFNILPFYQWQLAGSDEWQRKTQKEQTFNMDMLAHAAGFQTALSRQITPRLQAHVSGEAYRQHYREPERAERNDGKHYSLFGSAAYRLTPTQTVYAGLSGGTFRPDNTALGGRTNNAGNNRRGVSGGWLATWPKWGGLNTQLRAAYTDRRYRGSALNADFQWQQQRNKETLYSISAAHPKLSIAKFMPRLTWEQSRVRSTHKWAERKNNRLFVEIEKAF
ncbi:hypothetical periplasmic protein [Neisseria zoodegmatis]|uniref:Hypothetical periplasmic protein n=1 Tax=Neisseria zoodegmatis TaxID=326523 RepID=A0A378WHG2_9NEIS|nr:surface lipoprotein assembly modifier [Neisseria zoodegmatis]SUA36759.1 hypothetical periplasmic protein [Neisseria zoodegmatis]